MIKSKAAVQKLEKHLNMLMHPDGTPLRFVQFDHDSPGLRKLRRQIAEAIVYTIENDNDVLADFIASNAR